MTTSPHSTFDRMFPLTEALAGFAEAGIDPSFDAEMEELERQFAELRLSHARDGN